MLLTQQNRHLAVRIFYLVVFHFIIKSYRVLIKGTSCNILLPGKAEVKRPLNGKQNFDLQLKEVIDLITLQEMQDKFADATGLAAVITDREGKPITAPSNFSRYCKLIRSSSIGLKRCIQCDALVGLAAAQSRKTSIHCCHGGLVDLAAPIIVNRIYVGSVLCGQVLLHSSEQYDYLKTIRQKDQDLGLDVNLLVEYFQEIEIVPEKRVWAAADLLSIMANYIIESGMATLT